MIAMHHVAIAVTDIAEALNWYSGRLDVATLYTDDSWALLRFDNIALALAQPNQHPPHVAIERDSAESYSALKPHRDVTASVYIRDPGGNAVEIMKRGSRS